MKQFILILICIQSLIGFSQDMYIVQEYKSILQKNKDLNVKNNYLVYPVNILTKGGYTNANPYGHINSIGFHLGVDLSKPGNTDYRDTIYSIGYGTVISSYDAMVAIKHELRNHSPIVSSYYHCDTIFVKEGKKVKVGQPIALIGKKYTTLAHLHFEISLDTNRIASFYGEPQWYNTDPIKFIKKYLKEE